MRFILFYILLIIFTGVSIAETVILPVIEDATIIENTPTNNYGSLDYLYCNNLAQDWERRMLLKFDCSPLPLDAAVKSAKLKLWASQKDVTVSIHEVIAPWNELEITWNTFNDGGVSGFDYFFESTENYCVREAGTFMELQIDNDVIDRWRFNDNSFNQGLVVIADSGTEQLSATSIEYDNSYGSDYSAFIEVEYFLISGIKSCSDAIEQGYHQTTDINGDCRVDIIDLAVLASQWQKCVNPMDDNCLSPWNE